MSTLGSLVLSFLKRHTVQIKTKMRMIFKIIFTGLPKAPKILTLLTTKTLPSKWITSIIRRIIYSILVQLELIEMWLVPPRVFRNAYQYYYHPTFFIFLKMLRMHTVDNNFYIHHLQVMQTRLHSHISYNGVVKFLKSLLKDCKNDF